MARQNINVGTAANDGTGDTLRAAGGKINDNFVEVYLKLGGDSDALSTGISLTNSAIVYEGASVDSFETSLIVTDPTADRTITFPDATDTVVCRATTDTLTNKTLTSPVLTTPQINDTSADHQYVFAVSELAADRNVNLPLLTDSDTFVFEDHTQTLTNKTLTTPSITSPDITNGINDANGAESILLTATASAINEITVVNAATGNHPSINATGDNTNINLTLSGKGTGAVNPKKLAYQSETISANGSSSTSFSYHICNKATALAVTLPNGTVTGEVQNFVCKGAGTTTITPTSFATGTTVTIEQGEAASFFWDGTNWFLLASFNGVLA